MFEEALLIRKRQNDNLGVAVLLNNISLNYSLSGNLKSAINFAEQSIIIYEKIKNKRGMAYAYINLSNLYFVNNKKHLALEYALKAQQLAEEIKYIEVNKLAANRLFQIYKNMGHFSNALKNYEIYIKMRDSITNQETRKASIKSQLKYEYEKKAAADSVKIAEEKKLTTIKLQQEKTQRYYLYASLGLVGLFALFMFNRFRVTNKQKKLIEEQKKLVEEQKHLVDEKQKEILDSIHYAKRIQKALLPSEKYIIKKIL